MARHFNLYEGMQRNKTQTTERQLEEVELQLVNMHIEMIKNMHEFERLQTKYEELERKLNVPHPSEPPGT